MVTGYQDSLSHTSHEERPLRDLVQQLSRDGSLLMQQEMALAKKEIEEKVERLKTQVVSMALGGVALHAGALVILAALTLLLAEAMPAWIAALIVGVVVCVVGYVLVQRGKKKLEHMDLTPKKSMDSVRSDFHMMKEAVR